MSTAIRSAKQQQMKERESELEEEKQQAQAIDMLSLSLFSFLLCLFPLSLSLSVALFQVSPFDFNLALTLTLLSSPLPSPPLPCLSLFAYWLDLPAPATATAVARRASHLSIVIISLALLSNQHNPVCVKDSKPRAVKEEGEREREEQEGALWQDLAALRACQAFRMRLIVPQNQCILAFFPRLIGQRKMFSFPSISSLFASLTLSLLLPLELINTLRIGFVPCDSLRLVCVV